MTVESESRKEKRLLKYNNWVSKLPDDHYPPVSGEPKVRSGWFREVVDRNGGMDLVIGIGYSNKQSHSKLYLGQTYRQFFVIIDRLIEEAGLTDILDSYLNFVSDVDSNLQSTVRKLELERITEPVIQRMLEMGYNKYDLGS